MWNEEETSNGNASILKALSVVIETETNDDDDEMNDENDCGIEKAIEEPMQAGDGQMGHQEIDEIEKDGDKGANGNDDGAASEMANDEQKNAQTNHTDDNQMGNEPSTSPAEENDESDRKSNKNEDSKSSRTTSITPIASIKGKNKIEVKIPPIWTPSEKRANAALIYLYFRSVSRP